MLYLEINHFFESNIARGSCSRKKRAAVLFTASLLPKTVVPSSILCMFSPLSFGRRGRPDDATGPDLGWFHPFRDFVRKKDHQGFTARDLALQVRVTYDNSPRHVISKKTRNHDLLVMIWCDQRQRILYQFLEFGCAPCAHTRFAVSPLFLDALALSTSVDGLLFSSYFGRLGMTKLASY